MTEPALLELFTQMEAAAKGITARSHALAGEAAQVARLRDDLAELLMITRRGIPIPGDAIVELRQRCSDAEAAIMSSAIAEGHAGRAMEALVVRYRANADTLEIDTSELADANTVASLEELLAFMRKRLDAHGHTEPECKVCKAVRP